MLYRVVGTRERDFNLDVLVATGRIRRPSHSKPTTLSLASVCRSLCTSPTVRPTVSASAEMLSDRVRSTVSTSSVRFGVNTLSNCSTVVKLRRFSRGSVSVWSYPRRRGLCCSYMGFHNHKIATLVLHTPTLSKCHLNNYHVCSSAEESTAVGPVHQRGTNYRVKAYKQTHARVGRSGASMTLRMQFRHGSI